MTYELWDVDAGLFLGRFTSEAEALQFVRRVLDEEGEGYAGNLELAIGDDGARNLSGAELAGKALAVDKVYESTLPHRRRVG
jgi:hypothetical protein